MLNVTAEWIQKWPDNNFVWTQRLIPLQMNRGTPDVEVERVAEGFRKTGDSGNGGSTSTLQIASLYLHRGMHLSHIPDMVKEGIRELDRVPVSSMVSDLYPAPSGMGPRSMQLMNRMMGYNTLADAYLKTDHSDLARATLGEMRKNLDVNKPDDLANDFEKRNWSRMTPGIGTGWDKLRRSKAANWMADLLPE